MSETSEKLFLLNYYSKIFQKTAGGVLISMCNNLFFFNRDYLLHITHRV